MTIPPNVVTVVITEDQLDDRLPDLRWELHDAVLAGSAVVVADVSHIRRLTSATLATLLYVHRRCRARGGGVIIRGANAATRDLLLNNGLHQVFRLETADDEPGRPVDRRRA